MSLRNVLAEVSFCDSNHVTKSLSAVTVLGSVNVWNVHKSVRYIAKKFDGTEKMVKIGSMDGCIFLLENMFVGTRLRIVNTRVLFVGVHFPLLELPVRGQSYTTNRF